MSNSGKKEKTQFASDTSNRSISDWIKALAVLFVGLVIAHLGVTMFILSELGSDPFNVFTTGLAGKFGVTVGTVHMIILCLLMVVMFLTTKGYIKPGTVVCAFCGGPIIDFFSWILGDYINADASMIIRVISIVAGCVILAAGMSIVINSNAGTGPNDLIAIILSDKIPAVEFRWMRVICDLFFVVVGFFMGGTVGAGTIVAVFLTGPCAQFWLPKTKKVVAAILKE